MSKSYGPKPTADNLKDQGGVGSIRKVGHQTHEGTTKRPTERKSLDELTAEDIKTPSPEKESGWANPNFGRGGEKKG